MDLKTFFPFVGSRQQELIQLEKQAKAVDSEDKKLLAKAFRTTALALGGDTLLSSLTERTDFEAAPYDFTRIVQAIDTDSYAKQAYAKYRQIFWKEGWSIVGENTEAVDYLYQRIDLMEAAMGRPFQEFLADVVDQLVKFHNVFIVKARAEEVEAYSSQSLETIEKAPIIGYYMIPTEQVEIRRDKFNRPRSYRQKVTDTIAWANRVKDPTWRADQVIHMYRDRKPGRAFGTPFVTSALDDIIALRQIEEDLQNLIHRELFPLIKYVIGSDMHPAEQNDIDNTVIELEAMRTEGGIVLPHWHDVEIMGTQGNLLDASNYLDHFKERVAVGLGVFPHHLGMVSGLSTQGATDRLDAELYCRIRDYQHYIEESIRLHILDELLCEGGFDPSVNPRGKGMSDRCMLKFPEPDIDSQIKREAHTLQKLSVGAITLPEARLEMRMSPDMDEADSLAAMQVRLMPDQAVTVQTGGGSGGGASSGSGPSASKGSPSKAVKMIDTTPAAAKQSSTGGKPNMPNKSRGSSNVVRPTNQYGSRTSPNIRRSEDDFWYTELVELIDVDIQENK